MFSPFCGWSIPEHPINEHWIEKPGVQEDSSTDDGQPCEIAPGALVKALFTAFEEALGRLIYDGECSPSRVERNPLRGPLRLMAVAIRPKQWL
jgi:hypothetical protein